ncbi:hypothetical protein K504DRAFT_457968 [Pleomassaria siparia CBS 279.74]|uniref:F-box domain-containing protein n=1 Tax=Pleomassaria siparia CBS 279.74 TaxID=1314801 RepID=A0A6G1K527_9PLEO|nr:hypothetical protein K504DRAFT_457968 [Pleomassaria siparia CBS 279.74]
MASPIECLPNELSLLFTEYLLHGDLALLSRVSKHFQAIIEPILWTKVELHSPSFHEHYIHKELQETEKALHRPYQFDHAVETEYRSDRDSHHDKKALLFVNVLNNRHNSDPGRIRHLAGLVRWLCLPVANMYSEEDGVGACSALASLANLEYLEISAFWNPPYKPVPFSAFPDPLSKLRTLKLRGYVPGEFVSYVYQSASTITELELGLLVHPAGLEMCQGAEEYLLSCARAEERDESGKYVVYVEAYMAPTIHQFTSLTRLYLCRPTPIEEDQDAHFFDFCGFSDFPSIISSEFGVLDEWATLLQATRNTLVHVTLDHRPVGDEYEPRNTSNIEYMIENCHGDGYFQFVDTVLPVFLHEQDWPALQTIQLFGFECDNLDHPLYEQGFDIDKQLQERFPNVRVTTGIGKRILYQYDTGTVVDWGDVLDSPDGFSDHSHSHSHDSDSDSDHYYYLEEEGAG